jgi:hypothetical protein
MNLLEHLARKWILLLALIIVGLARSLRSRADVPLQR